MAQNLKVTIVGDASSLDRTFKRVSSSAGSFGSKLSGAFRTAAKGAAILVSGAALGGLAVTLHTGTAEWAEHAKVAAQTAQVLKTTGGVANVTQQHVSALANAILQKTGIDDEAVQSTENLLLGFTNLHNEVGKGNQIFDRATQAVIDYSVRTGKDATKASIAFGRALNDPAKNLGALTRYGIQFTDAQKKQIVALEKSGKVMDEQKLVLKAIEQRYKGAAEAAGNTLPGKLNILRENFRNVAGDLVGLVAPAFSTVIGLADKGVKAFGDFVHQLGQQKGLGAKLDFAVDTGRDLAVKIGTAVGNAVAQVDWHAVWARAQGIGDGLAAKLQATNWSAVGAAIGDGIATGVSAAGTVGKKLADIIGQAVRNVDWNSLGRAAGPGLAAAMLSAVAALTDPGFWRKNWDLILAVALTVFSDGVGRIAGKLAAPLTRVMGDALLAIVGTIERFSPRIASALLTVFLRAPGDIGGALGRVVSVVSSAFGKLGGLAKFSIKVLGIDAAIQVVVSFATTVKGWIDKIVGWFKALPGRIVGALGHVSLTGIGESIMQSLLGGLESGFSKVSGFLHGVTSKIPHLKGPESKDAVLLYANGLAVMAGFQRGLESGWGDNEAFLSKTAGRIQAAMSRLQAQLDAAQQRSTDRQNAQSLADAEKQLAAARKSGKGLAAAEQSVQDALQQIRDAAGQRELTKLQAQHDKILAKIQALKDKAATKLQALQTAAGSAFDDLASRIQSAFQAKNDAWVSPIQQQIDQITRGDQQAQLEKAVSDAQQGVADAMANGGDVLGAQAQLQQAQHDLLINGVGGLADQAAAQQKAHDNEVAAQQDTLNKALEALRTHLVDQGTVYSDGMSDILGIIGKFDGPFGDVGALLGDSFVSSLIQAAKATAAAGGAVQNAGGGGGAGGGGADAVSRALGVRVLHLATGGDITRSGFAFVHAGERVSQGSAAASPLGRGGGSITFAPGAIQLHGSLITERQLEDVVVGAIVRANQNGNFDVDRDLR